jgi:hypothetical protein
VLDSSFGRVGNTSSLQGCQVISRSMFPVNNPLWTSGLLFGFEGPSEGGSAL